ncbi:MAG: thiosulfate oxidation carrier protein SoxY [Gammaproteobacteria bacterium]|nr:MAG: thiosulfate oxidation carrier protein SoxY [Gammaproteobacteria bacterium]
MKRRIFLKGSLLSGLISFAAGSSLLLPLKLLANWNKEAFQATDMKTANAALGDTTAAIESDRVFLDVKDIAENAAVVPVKVSTDLENAESIRIYVENNPNPLIATFKLSQYTDNFVFIRTKMRETSNVIAMVEADGQLYMAKKQIKVTAGGCGG